MSKSKEEMKKGAKIPIEGDEENLAASETAEEILAEDVEDDQKADGGGDSDGSDDSGNGADEEAPNGTGPGAEEEEEAGADAPDAEEDEQDPEAEADEGSAGDSGDDMQTKYMRLLADFQNYKRRTENEKKDIYSFANEKLIVPVLDVMDNFERALEQGSSDTKFCEGMQLILTQLNDALSKAGLAEIEALGEEFDPNFHSAVIMEETEDYESGKVSNVVQKGYTLNGKVIRPSMVKVAK